MAVHRLMGENNKKHGAATPPSMRDCNEVRPTFLIHGLMVFFRTACPVFFMVHVDLKRKCFRGLSYIIALSSLNVSRFLRRCFDSMKSYKTIGRK